VKRELGILINANARSAKRDTHLVDRLRRRLPPGRVHATRHLEDVAPALDALLAEPLDALLLIGGDGTLARTLTALLTTQDAAKLPAIVPTRGGTVNTVATSLGARGTPEQTLAGLLRGDPFRDERRAVARIVADDGAPVFGFLFANGVGARFLQLYYGDSPMGPAGAMSVLSRIAGSALVGGDLAKRVFAPFAATLSVDDRAPVHEKFTVIMAGSVRHVGLGFPVLHSAGSDPERIHFATTGASPAQIAVQLPALRAGSPGRSLDHYSARHVVLEFAEPLAWMIDAEVFPPARRLEISAGPALRFRTPRPVL
jgi:diacylglycerol kinase family enzyme